MKSSTTLARNGERALDSQGMTVYLFDTDIIIYSLKGNTTVTERNLATAHRVAEIYPMLTVTQSVIETFDGIRASLETAGTPLNDMDLLIGATALSHNLTLVTYNEKHFSRIAGLSVANWAT